MKNSDIVFNYITEKVTTEHILNCVNLGEPLGVNASELQEKLNIVRNNASTILNELWKSSKLIKINTRPVEFIPRAVVEKILNNESQEIQNTLSVNEFTELINKPKEENKADDPFKYLLGSNNSLLYQIEQAKAAIIYPPNGLHTLILGESGVGKTTFAYAMYEYGKVTRGYSDKMYPFVSFNCSDYFNNPQLLLSQLFGHCKGAFTGADTEKVGLVEKANGGILFLDEIHRLPPDGQEMLFYLMDKGEYHRLGETESKRKSNVLIIAATTEEPNDMLLATFLRRIPVVITLPSVREKDIGERIEIIQSLFSYESEKLNMKIRVSPQVLKALALYEFKVGNIGQLRSEIKLICAKAFLEHLQNDQELIIEYKMLDKGIREYYLSYKNENKNIKAYLDMFSEDLIISPSDEKEFCQSKSKNDIYEHIIKRLDSLKEKGLDKEEIDLEINELIENHFKDLMESFNSNRLNLNQLYKIVPKDVTDYCIELINIAENELSTKFNSKFIFGFAMHIQSLLKRISEGKPIKNPNMMKIKRDFPDEYEAAKVLVARLNDKFGIIIPEDEKGFLTILLANNKIDVQNEEKTRIVILCHGESTATSMASVANSLLNSEFVKAIDMPLDADINDTYNKLKAMTLAINKGSGILLLVDMGSLESFGEKLMNETGIKVKTIGNVSTLMAIEALRNVLYKSDDIEEIFKALANKNTSIITESKAKKKAILTVCMTGQGASMIAKNILERILENEFKDKFEIVTTNYIDNEKDVLELKSKYELVAVIGSYNPNINVPYFPISRLLSESFQREFRKFLDTSCEENNQNLNKNKSAYEISKEMLEQYVKYINPKIAVVNIKKFIDLLELKYNESQDETIDLIVHMGCMLDRCIHRDYVKFENVEEYKRKNIKLFNRIRELISFLETEYNVYINDDELCYIIKILNR